MYQLLNQARAWFPEIDPVRTSVCMCVCVCLCVCPLSRLLITSGVIWHDMDHKQLVMKVLQLLYGNCNRHR